MKFKLPFSTDRGAAAAELSTRLDSAPSVDIATPPVSAAPNSDAVALEIGRRVMREMAAGASPTMTSGGPGATLLDPFPERRAIQETKIQALRDAMQARAATQAEALDPLHSELAAAETAYDDAYAAWEVSPVRLAMVRADETLEAARARLNDQERHDREELSVLAVQIQRLQSEMASWLTELSGGPGYTQWKPVNPAPPLVPLEFEHTLVMDNRVK